MRQVVTKQQPALTDKRLRAIFRELVRRIHNLEVRAADVEDRLQRSDLDGLEGRVGELEDGRS